MEQLQKIIEEANEKLVLARMSGQWDTVNGLNVVIAEAEVLLKTLQDAEIKEEV